MWRKGRSWFHSGKEAGYLLQMCADTPSSCLIRYREAPAFSLSVHLFLSHTLTCPSHFSPMPPLPVLPSIIPQWETLHVHLMSPVFFFLFFSPLPVQKRKMIQTMEMSTHQLLVAISSRLPQSQIRPQIKYKTETHAYCIWMLIPFHEILNCFWHCISRGPVFHVHIEIYEVPALDKSRFIDFSGYILWNTDHFRNIIQIYLIISFSF